MSPYYRILPSALALLTTLLIGAGLGQGQGQAAPDKGAPEKASGKTPTVQAAGTLVPEEVIDIGAQVPGKIIAFGPDLDDARKVIDYRSRVEKGTVLAKLDPTACETEVALAKAGLAVAEAEVVL